MPRTFADGTFLSFAGALVSGPPCTMAIWARSTAAADTIGLMGLTASGSDTERMGMRIQGGNQFHAESRSGGTFPTASIAGVTLNTWMHFCAVWASTSSRRCYLNGTEGTVESTLVTPLSLATTFIARYTGGTGGLEMNGQLCEAAIWNIALSASEITTIASGLRHKWMQPGNLISYVVINGTSSPEPDFVGGRNWTITGAPANYTTDAPPLFDAGAPVYEQVGYRWRQDNGSLIAP